MSIEIGDRIKTLADKGSRDWNPAMRLVQWGAEGVVCYTSDSHGKCFFVAHEDGGSAWYEPDEIEVIDPSPEFKALLASLGILRTRSIESAKFAFPIGTRVRFVEPDDYERIEVEDVIVGDPYEVPYEVRAERHVCIKLPTRSHGGILIEDLRVGFRDVLKLRALGSRGE